MEEKTALLKRVHAAHSHSSHADYDSIDYYIPKIDDEKGRRGSSAEGAEILMPTMQGIKLNMVRVVDMVHLLIWLMKVEKLL